MVYIDESFSEGEGLEVDDLVNVKWMQQEHRGVELAVLSS